MHNLSQRMSLTFAAGSLGGLANSLAVWLCGLLGITAALQVAIAPTLTPGWLYPRLVWGGIWGWLFLLHLGRINWIGQGLLLSLGPTLVQLFIVFPFKADKDVMGLDLGVFTPFFVIFFNAVWGLVAAYWLQRTR
jgi:hypothetical protein